MRQILSYNEFEKEKTNLKRFVENSPRKEINGTEYLLINDENVDEFIDIVSKLSDYSSNDYIEDILKYLEEANNTISYEKMINKLIPYFAAIHSFSTMNNIPDPNNEVKINDWVFELNDMENPPPLVVRFGKVINIDRNESGDFTYSIKIPLTNEVVEWENVVLIVVPNMEKILQLYQEKYIKIF